MRIWRMVRKRMDKTRMNSRELQCKQSPILGKVTEESWTHLDFQ